MQSRSDNSAIGGQAGASSGSTWGATCYEVSKGFGRPQGERSDVKSVLTERSFIRAAAVIVIALCLTCAPDKRPINVLIIGVDTLRPDHLGCYGYGRDTSPAIDGLAREGVLFENVVSQSPWTLPSFATVFTSLYPSQHGAMSAVTAMRTSFPTLAAILTERGYATGAIVNASVLRPEYGVNRGFEYYDPTPAEGRIADGTTRDALSWIDANTGRPFFLFAHYFDPHEPYAPPAPYDTLYRGDYHGPIGDSFVLFEHFPDVTGTRFDDMKTLDTADWDRIQALYDAEITFTDAAIEELLAGLRGRGLAENTLIVFLADHGEEFFEHQGFGHGHTLFNEVIRVPLVISLPKEFPRGTHIQRQVRLVDVMPTILDVLNTDTDIHCEGVSLVPLLTGDGGPEAREGSLFKAHIAYSEGLLRGSEKKSITVDPWKIVYDLKSHEWMMFDLEHDPGETSDVSQTRPEQLVGLRGLLLSGLFGTSGTWYARMCPSESGNAFSIEVNTESGAGTGHIRVAALLDEAGNDIDAGSKLEMETHSIRIPGIDLKRPVTLAFQVDAPPMLPLEFTIGIDGAPAVGKTFVGKDLTDPGTHPFSIVSRGSGARADTPPHQEVSSPAVVLWFNASPYGGSVAAKIDERTRQDLRALGYVQ
jgi:arylsulfatase A-like enzyme